MCGAIEILLSASPYTENTSVEGTVGLVAGRRV